MDQNQSYVTSDGQSVSLSWCLAPSGAYVPIFIIVKIVAGLLMWGTLSDEKTGLPFTIVPSPRQRSHSWVRVPHFTVSDSETPQPGGPGPCIHISQKQNGPVIPPGTGFPFRLLRFDPASTRGTMND
jgi:hypothetical protein